MDYRFKLTVFLLLFCFSNISYSQTYTEDEFAPVATSPVPSIVFPQFKGGKKGLNDFLKDNVTIPNSLSSIDKSGVIVILYKINSKGDLSVTEIDDNNTTLNPALHSIVIDALKSSGPWLRGTKNGNPFNAQLQISFQF